MSSWSAHKQHFELFMNKTLEATGHCEESSRFNHIP